jgi:hypothetical protein
LATADYGGRFQDAVGGWFLAKLLTHEPIAGIPGELVRVGFQRALHGAQLDDIVAETADGISVEFSIKGGVAIRAADRELRETFTRAWAGFKANGNAWSGLIAPPTATGIADLTVRPLGDRPQPRPSQPAVQELLVPAGAATKPATARILVLITGILSSQNAAIVTSIAQYQVLDAAGIAKAHSLKPGLVPGRIDEIVATIEAAGLPDCIAIDSDRRRYSWRG